MLEINEKSHISVVISSLDKIYKQAKMDGQLHPKDIYYLNIMYKLLNNSYIELSNEQKQHLVSLYNKITFKSKYICPPTLYKKHQQTKQTFTQAETSDCGDINTFAKIFYWQEEDFTTTIENIIPQLNTEFLSEKLSDSYLNFETGKTIDYSEIGRICFLAMSSNTIDYIVKDILDNDITDAFDLIIIDEIQATLFVSKNIYSFGDIFFKIIKGTQIINPGPFDDTFGDEFE